MIIVSKQNKDRKIFVDLKKKEKENRTKEN